jgi:nitrate/TMAO reductase-like tetraheme cytochrome c subunit
MVFAKNNINYGKRGFQKGHKLIPWNKGKKNVYKKHALELMKQAKIGTKPSINTRMKMSKAHTGNKCNFWKGGINKESDKVRKNIEYRLWREAVYARDNFTCQKCHMRGGRLNAHHIKSFSMHPELRVALDNGVTLCIDCHKKTDSYLKGRINGYKS